MAGSSEAEFVKVRRRDLERLTTEVMQMREFLPQILSPELVESLQRLEVAESALEKKELDCDHLQARLEAAQSECLRGKEENLSLVAQLSSAQEESVQQAEFCSHMGAVLCTLLWGITNREETVKSILGTEGVTELFSLASSTLTSYVASLPAEAPPSDDSMESRFVLGLAGTVTNVAAVASGRHFLVTSCGDLLERWIRILSQIQLGTCSRLRVLLLMSLYNVSIHRGGLLWMSQEESFIRELRRLLTDPDPEVCLHTLRLLQSLMLDAGALQAVRGEVAECRPFIMALSHSGCTELKEAAEELLGEMEELQLQEDQV